MLLGFFLTAGSVTASAPLGPSQRKSSPAARPKKKKPGRNVSVRTPLLVPPPNVQNSQLYSIPDQTDFSAAAGYQYAPTPIPVRPGPKYQLRKGAVVFGWHPYWMSNAYVNYDFSLLTHVAYYGYQANDLGQLSLAAPVGQGPEGLIAAARRKNPACKVLLTIAYPAAEGATSLLRPAALPAQDKLLDAIVSQVVGAQADGVNLDFSPPDEKPQMLARRRQALARAAAALRLQQSKLTTQETQLKQQQTQLAPGIDPSTRLDSALVLAAQKEALDSIGQQLTQEQANLTKAIAANRLAYKKLLYQGELLGFLKRWLYQDKELKAYKQDSTQLAKRQLAYRTSYQANRRGLKLNAIETRNYAARQGRQQQALVETQGQVALNEAQQATTQTQQTKQQQAEAALRLQARSYPGMPPAMRPLATRAGQLQDFIARLAVRLRARNPAYVVTLNVPAVDNTQTYQNLQAVEPVVALFIIKAFDYTAYNQITPGALAPLNPSEAWGPHSIATSVAYYLKEGTVRPQQLLVGLPHLAKVWQLDSLNGQEVSDLRPPAYWTNQQLRALLPVPESKLDLASLSRFTTLAPATPGQLAPQAWWEDSVSLAPKYAWINKQHLAGVGIWALGYDNGSPQVWNLLRASFAGPIKVVKPAAPAPRGPLAVLYGVRHVILLSLVVLIGFLLAGLLLALFRRVDALVPNPPLLSILSLLIGLCGLCIGLYTVLFGHLVLSAWGVAVLAGGALVLVLLVYQRYWRQQILP